MKGQDVPRTFVKRRELEVAHELEQLGVRGGFPELTVGARGVELQMKWRIRVLVLRVRIAHVPNSSLRTQRPLQSRPPPT